MKRNFTVGVCSYFTLVTDLCGSEKYLLQPLDKQELKTPFYPNQYPPNVLCIWTISSAEGGFPSITFLDVSIHETHDVLLIWARGQKVLELQGENKASSVTANDTSLIVEFDSWKHTYWNRRGVFLEMYWSIANGKPWHNV